MFSRIANAIETRLRAAMRAEITAQRDAERKQVRELVGEMEDVLEKFSRVVAREAMRRSRDMKKVLDDEGTPAALPSQPGDRKAALRAQLRQGQLPLRRPHSTAEGNGQ